MEVQPDYGAGSRVETPGSWRKATYSNIYNSCVEVGNAEMVVSVRDTTNRAGVILSFKPAAWKAFTDSIVVLAKA